MRYFVYTASVLMITGLVGVILALHSFLVAPPSDRHKAAAVAMGRMNCGISSMGASKRNVEKSSTAKVIQNTGGDRGSTASAASSTASDVYI